MRDFSLKLPLVAPFRLDLTAWALRRRPGNLIDLWQGDRYMRAFAIAGQVYRVSVEQRQEETLDVVVSGTGHPKGNMADVKAVVARCLRRMFGLEIDLSGFYRLVAEDPYVGPLAERFAGLKPPRFPTIFEALLNAFACQQVSLEVGILLLNRLAERYGLPFPGDQPVLHAFPKPEDLARVAPEELRTLGFSRQKARSIFELARSLSDNVLSLSGLEGRGNDEVELRLREMRGVGRWTAEYVLLRGLGRLDVFPGDDVGAHRNLQKLLHLEERPDYEQIGRLTARWQPYAGLVYFHLLLSGLERKGLV